MCWKEGNDGVGEERGREREFDSKSEFAEDCLPEVEHKEAVGNTKWFL